MSWPQMLLADDLFFFMHDDRTGRPRLHPRAVGLGLAGALLGELMLFNRLTIQDGVLAVVDDRPPRDAVIHALLDQVLAERQPHGVRTWLAFFSQGATEQVAARMVRAGHVTRVEPRWPRWSGVRWVPADMSTAAWPAARLRHRLHREEPLDTPDVVLTGLVDAAGLTSQVLWGVSARTLSYRDHLIAVLPAHLRDLDRKSTRLNSSHLVISYAVFCL